MNPRLRSAIVIAAVVLLDRLTKMYIRADISPMDIIPVIPGFFNIVHTENPGAAFGFLAALNVEWRGILLIAVSLIVMTIIGSLLWRNPANPILETGLALVFGGALGNVWDRIARGTVTDFLQFFFGSYEFPSFNAADSAITIGAGLLLIDLWMNRKEPRKVYS
jgi:signal peptidase II